LEAPSQRHVFCPQGNKPLRRIDYELERRSISRPGISPIFGGANGTRTIDVELRFHLAGCLFRVPWLKRIGAHGLLLSIVLTFSQRGRAYTCP
jgi:hypothetical protein